MALRGSRRVCPAVSGYPWHMSALDSAARAASYTGGQMLGAATRVIAARPATKPLHPRGSVVQGTLHRDGTQGLTGAGWLDTQARTSCWSGSPEQSDYRLPSRTSMALPSGCRPRGAATATCCSLRRGSDGSPASRSPLPGRRTGDLTTLLPYRTPVGAVLLSAVFRDESRAELVLGHPLTYDWVRQLREPPTRPPGSPAGPE